ncbi:hypothetical protein [Roseibium sp.]|uniref:hypothetical protein n=1 Tax=Roseibium sp. TaxID=1936156 RepID=UPI003BAADEAC
MRSLFQNIAIASFPALIFGTDAIAATHCVGQVDSVRLVRTEQGGQQLYEVSIYVLKVPDVIRWQKVLNTYDRADAQKEIDYWFDIKSEIESIAVYGPSLGAEIECKGAAPGESVDDGYFSYQMIVK